MNFESEIKLSIITKCILKCFCFQKIFAEGMLTQFLNVLLQVLVHRSHDLLQEEITVTIYNMACVNLDNFYTSFLHQFLAECEGVTPDQKNVLHQNFTSDKVNIA